MNCRTNNDLPEDIRAGLEVPVIIDIGATIDVTLRFRVKTTNRTLRVPKPETRVPISFIVDIPHRVTSSGSV